MFALEDKILLKCQIYNKTEHQYYDDGFANKHFLFFFQLAKVGLPINAINGGNPLGNGIINPAGISP